MLGQSRGSVDAFPACVLSSSTDCRVTCPLSRFESWDCDPDRGIRTEKFLRRNHVLSEPRRPPRRWPSACWPRCRSKWLSTTATRSCRLEALAPRLERPEPAQRPEDVRGRGSELYMSIYGLSSAPRDPSEADHPAQTPVLLLCSAGLGP